MDSMNQRRNFKLNVRHGDDPRAYKAAWMRERRRDSDYYEAELSQQVAHKHDQRAGSKNEFDAAEAPSRAVAADSPRGIPGLRVRKNIRVIHRNYRPAHTFEEIAKVIGVTPQGAFVIYARALEKIRMSLRSEPRLCQEMCGSAAMLDARRGETVYPDWSDVA
jgi:hypothetical protein